MKSLQHYIIEAFEHQDNLITNEEAINKILTFVRDNIVMDPSYSDRPLIYYVMEPNGTDRVDAKKFINECNKLLNYLKTVGKPADKMPTKKCGWIHFGECVDKLDYNASFVLSFGIFDFKESGSVSFMNATKYGSDDVEIMFSTNHMKNYKRAFSDKLNKGNLFLIDIDLFNEVNPECWKRISKSIQKADELEKQRYKEYEKFISKMKGYKFQESDKKFVKDRLDDEKTMKSIKRRAISSLNEIENIVDKENWFVINLFPNRRTNKFEDLLEKIFMYAKKTNIDISFKHYTFVGRESVARYSQDHDMYVINWPDLIKTNIPSSFFDMSFREWKLFTIDTTDEFLDDY